tara:strand:+ start:3179 stop:4207 length:1029 start_codon:yes stop_codon:yes gene_type:complete
MNTKEIAENMTVQEMNELIEYKQESLRKNGMSPESSLIDAEDKVKAMKRFEKEFVKPSLTYIVKKFKKTDLPLLNLMVNNEVNSNNRKKSHDNINNLFRCMLNGHWYEESNDVMVSSDGILLNGQHTITAGIMYLGNHKTPDDAVLNLSFKLGCRAESIGYADCGRSRDPLDSITLVLNNKNKGINKFQRDVIKFQTKAHVHGHPFRRMQKNSAFEYEATAHKYSDLLNNLFGEIGFPRKTWFGGIRYALFRLGLEDEELAIQIVNEVRDEHNDGSDDIKSIHCPNERSEHDLIEFIRSVRYSAKHENEEWRPWDYYNQTIVWLEANYANDIDFSIFNLSED